MYKIYKNNGSILIMSLFILSGILIIGAAVGTIVLNQLKQSKNLDFSIIAYYTADSAMEDVLYKLRKLNQSVGYLNQNDFFGNVNNSNDWTWNRNIASTTPYYVLLKKNRPILINLYDSELDCGLVRRVRYIWSDLTPLTNNPYLEVTYYAWNITGGINVLPEEGEQEYYNPISENLVSQDSPNGPWNATNTLITLMENTCYTIRVKSLYDDSNLFIKTYDDYNATEQIGIPSFLTIDSLGRYKTSKQRIKTIVLKEPPLSSIFEFVLFSEEPITKY